ncbi:MAG: hypothetical protein IIB19_03355 [Chloroflexi bacterium]|nr:hypothetical protein [Chloroflexota bacterium]
MAVKVPSKVTLQSPSVMIWLSVGLAALYWVLEALMDAFVFNEGGFVERLITPDRNELWMRVMIAGLLMGFGVYGSTVIRWRKRAQEGRSE